MGAQGKHGTLRLIGTFKLLKGLLLAALALGLFRLLNGDWESALDRFSSSLNVDPGSKYFQLAARKIAHISSNRNLVVAGGLFYAALFSIEGIGLLLGKRWAEYLTVIVTGSFLPLEFYEIVKQPTVMKGVAIGVNLAIVVYLIFRLKKERH